MAEEIDQDRADDYECGDWDMNDEDNSDNDNDNGNGNGNNNHNHNHNGALYQPIQFSFPSNTGIQKSLSDFIKDPTLQLADSLIQDSPDEIEPFTLKLVKTQTYLDFLEEKLLNQMNLQQISLQYKQNSSTALKIIDIAQSVQMDSSIVEKLSKIIQGWAKDEKRTEFHRFACEDTLQMIEDKSKNMLEV